MTQAQTAASQGYVLGATEGEHLVHFRDVGNIFIKVGPATGSDSLALGTQQVPVGAGIPIHRHLRIDEAFYVLEGSGFFTLNDARRPFEKGGTIFIPRNAWHGFANPDHELLLEAAEFRSVLPELHLVERRPLRLFATQAEH